MTLPQMTDETTPEAMEGEAVLRALLDRFTRVDALAEHTVTNSACWEVAQGSPLAGDDAKTDPHQVSHSAQHAFVVAVDHLHALACLVRGTEKDGAREMLLHSYAPFTLLRAALENAARAVWLLGPASRQERVHRCLTMHLADRAGLEKKAKLIDAPLDGSPGRRDQIMDLLRAAGVPELEMTKKNLRMPDWADIVGDAGKQAKVENAVLLWGLCSALAHGDLGGGTLIMLNRELMITDGDVSWARVSASPQRVLAMTQAALVMVEHAFTLYATRGRAPF